MKLLIAACAAAALTLSALAAETKPDAPELAAFTRTGETETCLRAASIRSTRILNGHQILFEMKGGKTWLNEADCVGLRKHSVLSYRVDVGTICTSTVVHVLDGGAGLMPRGSCFLSPWEELAPKPKAEPQG
jgi:hypothetical protein